jgi:putative redox protein
MITTTTWKGDLLFESSQGDFGAVVMDGHLKKGMSPKALLLSGLSGCSAVDVVEILQKMRVPFEALTVTAQAEQTEEHPRVFKEILLVFSVQTAVKQERPSNFR